MTKEEDKKKKKIANILSLVRSGCIPNHETAIIGLENNNTTWDLREM